MQPALFLDRDGVIVEEAEYLSDPAKMRLIPGAAAAIARVNQRGIPVVVVSNQSGVARGYFSEASVAEVHCRLDELLASAGAHIDRYYFCPHHPTEGQGAYRAHCLCRKPQPGMLLRAARELELDLPRSWMIGDKLSDLEAGVRARCATILVCTGYGGGLVDQVKSPGAKAAFIAADLADAVTRCLPTLVA